ncbi:metallophosphoesterase family protein [Thomasclavelia cocleata]|uniref:metallophosphoesterase family protein n=1 Tax=Thomasclavelia cocleata TaxID=69824 RepID=UPI0025846A55|nr:metallophosphoesterase [Thomasclavelia cocleata]
MKTILSKFSKVLLTSTVVLNSGIIVPAFAQNFTEKPNISFFALSDTHVEAEGSQTKTYEGLEDALSDIIEINPDNSALVIPGDLTNNGLESEYEAVYGLIDKYQQVGQPMLAMGNHDVRWLCSSGDRNPASPTVPTCKPGTSPFDSRYLKFNQKYMGDVLEGQLYFDQWIDGYHFITLNTEQDLKDKAYLSEKQLLWLDNTLAKNADKNKPIFIKIH